MTPRRTPRRTSAAARRPRPATSPSRCSTRPRSSWPRTVTRSRPTRRRSSARPSPSCARRSAARTSRRSRRPRRRSPGSPRRSAGGGGGDGGGGNRPPMTEREEEPRVVIRDKRRIDPTSGTVRVPAGDQPAGARPGVHPAGEQMSEHEAADGAQPTVVDDDLTRQLAERTEDLQRVTAEYANYRRRVDRDRQLVVDQAAERFAAQLFPIVDDIERARDHGELTGGFKSVA